MPNTYNVYIQHWYNNSTGKPDEGSEKLMFSVPQNNPNGFPVISPSVKGSEDSADSLDFTLNAVMEYYDLLIPFITMIRVEYYGVNIFYGRVLTINASTVMQTKSIHCEGNYAFLNDSYYPATASSKRSSITWSSYFAKIISNHNSSIAGDNHKEFNIGEISFTPTTDSEKFEPTSWTQSSSLLSSLKNEYGGHMLARYEGGKNYIDWYQYHRRDLGDDGIDSNTGFPINSRRPVVRVGENVIDISSNMDVGNLFTRVIPIGKSQNDGTNISIDGYTYTDKYGVSHTHSGKYMSVNLIRGLYSDSELNNGYHTANDFDVSEHRYGILYKTMSFSDASTQSELWDECKKWIKNSFYGAVVNLEIKAIDMRIINTSNQEIRIGECVDIYYKIYENGQMITKYRKMICKSIKYDLFNPSNNTYTFGIPSDLLNVTSRSSSSSKSTSSTVASTTEDPDDTTDTNLTFARIADIIRNDPDVENGYGGDAAADSFIANGKLSGSVNVYDADIHYDPVGHPEICFTGQIVGKITISGKVTKWVAINNAHGLFAYIDDVEASITGAAQVVAAVVAGNANVARPTTHWYIRGAGYTYNDFSVWQTVAATTSVQAVIAAAKGIAVYAGASSIVDLVGNTVKAATIDSVQGVVKTANKMSLDVQNSIISLLPGQKNSSGNEIISAQIGGNDGGKMSVFDEWGNKIMEAAGKDQKMSFYERVGSSMSGKVSASIQAASGTVASIVSKIGKDGSGTDALTSILQNGSDGSMTLYNLNGGSTGDIKKKAMELLSGTGFANWFNTGTDSSTEQKTVEINAAGTSGEGKISAGKKSNGSWRVKINEPLTYTDSSGVEHTLEPGFVSAEDFHISSQSKFISLKSKLIVTDNLVAGKVDAQEIKAEREYVGKLKAGSIQSDSAVYSSYIRATTVVAGTFQYPSTDPGHAGANIGNCFNGCVPSLDSGKLKLSFSKVGGGTYDTDPFDITATTWYKNQMVAAHNAGGATAYAKVSKATLNPGESSTITAYYTNKKGAAVNTGRTYTVSANTDSNLTAGNIKNGVTIFGIAGTYSGGTCTDISLWDNANPSTRRTGNISLGWGGSIGLTAWCLFNGTWTKGEAVTVSGKAFPSVGSANRKSTGIVGTSAGSVVGKTGNYVTFQVGGYDYYIQLA